MIRPRVSRGLAALPICVLIALPADAGGLSAAGRGAPQPPPEAAPRARIDPIPPRDRPERPQRPPRPPRPPENDWLANTPDGPPEQRGCWWRPHPGAEWRWTCPDRYRRGYGIGYYSTPDYWLYGYVERHRQRRDAAADARATAAPPPPDPAPPPPDDHPWVTRGQTREAGQDGIQFVAPPD